MAEGNCPQKITIFENAHAQLKRIEEYIFPGIKYKSEDIEKFIQGDYRFSKSFLHQKLNSGNRLKSCRDIVFLKQS